MSLFPMNEEPTVPIDTKGAVSTAVPSASANWGSFELRARVGVGGFGEVYRAWDPSLQREVALKLLLPGSFTGDAEYESVLREARALASVRHPNIVSVYGIDRHDGRVGFWTDFVHGKTLSVLVGEQGRFGAREAALIGLDVTRALSAVHRAGLLHRDIKAENVMREEGGRILLMDFGLSTLNPRQARTAGTPNYMAPELFDGHPSTVASDIYAMGVLLYYLVAGDFPVRVGEISLLDVRDAMAKRKPLIDVRPDLPDSLLRTISTAMEPDPARRFTSAGQLASALAESMGTHVPVEIQTSAVKPPQRGTAGRALAAAAFAVLLVLGVILFGWPGYMRRASQSHATATPSLATDEQLQKAQDLLLHSYKLSNVAGAIKGLQAVLQAEPDSALAWARLGQAYFVQYDADPDPKLLKQVTDATNKAKSIDPELAVPYVTLSRVAALKGNTASATELAKKARKLDPRSAEAWAALGDVYSSESRTADEIDAYQKAADLAPEDWRWPVSLGIALYHAHNLTQSIAQLQRGVQLASDNAAAYFDLAIARSTAGQLDDALKDIQKSIELEPTARAFSQKGTILMFQGRYEDAVATEKMAIGLSPNRYSAWADMADAYEWSGKHPREAAQAYRKAIELEEAERLTKPQDAFLTAALAEEYARVGDVQRSEVMIRQAQALAPEDPSIAFSVGEAYEILGRRQRAIPLLARALAAGYGNTEFERNPTLTSLGSDPNFGAALRQANTRKQ